MRKYDDLDQDRIPDVIEPKNVVKAFKQKSGTTKLVIVIAALAVIALLISYYT